jgi:enterochelin esterase-like enzyme
VIVVDRIDSAHLARNLLGNPSQRDLVVYLPPSYGTSDRRYAVAYLLHGYSSRAMNWPLPPALTFAAVRTPIDVLLDEAIAAAKAEEMIVVMPDGWSKHGCGMWVDSPTTGSFERYVVEDVIGHVDATYRTLPDRDSRGVFGVSAGGFGTWHLGSRNPDTFGAMAVISGSAAFEITRKPWFYRYYDKIHPRELAGPLAGDIGSWFCYGLAAAYTPNPAKPPFYSDFPVEYPSGDDVPALWERWRSFDPVVNWRERSENLKRQRGILLDVGFRDELDYAYGNRILSRHLRAAGIRHDYEEHDGNHTNRMFERVQRAYGWLGTVLEHRKG